MFLIAQQYIPVKFLKDIHKIAFNYQYFFANKNITLDKKLYVILRNVDCSFSMNYFSIMIEIISHSKNIKIQLKDYNKILLMLHKNKFLENLFLNIHLEGGFSRATISFDMKK